MTAVGMLQKIVDERADALCVPALGSVVENVLGMQRMRRLVVLRRVGMLGQRRVCGRMQVCGVEQAADGDEVAGLVGAHPYGAVLADGSLKGKVSGDEAEERMVGPEEAPCEAEGGVEEHGVGDLFAAMVGGLEVAKAVALGGERIEAGELGLGEAVGGDDARIDERADVEVGLVALGCAFEGECGQRGGVCAKERDRVGICAAVGDLRHHRVARCRNVLSRMRIRAEQSNKRAVSVGGSM